MTVTSGHDDESEPVWVPNCCHVRSIYRPLRYRLKEYCQVLAASFLDKANELLKLNRLS